MQERNNFRTTGNDVKRANCGYYAAAQKKTESYPCQFPFCLLLFYNFVLCRVNVSEEVCFIFSNAEKRTNGNDSLVVNQTVCRVPLVGITILTATSTPIYIANMGVG